MENFSLPPREHKKVNYAEFEAFSDSSSENNKKQNHGNYISWSSSEDALLIEQVNKYLENQKNQSEAVKKKMKTKILIRIVKSIISIITKKMKKII